MPVHTQIDFGGVVEALPGLVWTTQANGRCDFVNRGWREYTGLGLDAAIDHGWQTAIHPGDLTSFLKSWDHISKSGHGGELGARLQRADGQYRWFMFRPSPMPDFQRWCWLGSHDDEGPTTDARTRRLWDRLPFRSGFMNAVGAMEFSNLESREILGATLQEMREWTTTEVMQVDDFDKNRARVKALLTTGEMFDEEVRMRHKDGVYRWARARAVAIRDAQGNAIRYLSCQIDIDDLKRAEALLAAEVKLLARVAEGESPGQVLDALSRHVEELCRGGVCCVLVVAPDKAHLQIGAGPNLPKLFQEILNGEAINNGQDPCSLAVIEKMPIIATHFADDPRWLDSPWLPAMTSLGYDSCFAIPILSALGEASGVVAIYRSGPVAPALQQQEGHLIDRFTKIAGIAIDRAEADAALDRARSELAHVARVATLNAMTASIAHEVSQPLSGILTNANTCVRMLAANPPNLAGAAETARRTIRDANRAAEVIRRLRAMFSTKPPSMEMADLNDVAREVIALSVGELRRSGALLQTDFANKLPHVSIDRVQLQQVILNLLLNAADAMAGLEDRPRTLLVKTGLQVDGSVKLLVRDSGMGIDPDKVERLFDAFYTTKAEGMGVGLSISRSIIARHEGRMWAEANDGPGATFSFCVPSDPARINS